MAACTICRPLPGFGEGPRQLGQVAEDEGVRTRAPGPTVDELLGLLQSMQSSGDGPSQLGSNADDGAQAAHDDGGGGLADRLKEHLDAHLSRRAPEGPSQHEPLGDEERKTHVCLLSEDEWSAKPPPDGSPAPNLREPGRITPPGVVLSQQRHRGGHRGCCWRNKKGF